MVMATLFSWDLDINSGFRYIFLQVLREFAGFNTEMTSRSRSSVKLFFRKKWDISSDLWLFKKNIINHNILEQSFSENYI